MAARRIGLELDLHCGARLEHVGLLVCQALEGSLLEFRLERLRYDRRGGLDTIDDRIEREPPLSAEHLLPTVWRIPEAATVI